MGKSVVARMWQGRTRAAIAEEYAAGADIEKTHHLPKDPEYLLELPPTIAHFEILFDERG